MNELRERLFVAGFETGSFLYAGNEPANNKMHLDGAHLQSVDVSLYNDVIAEMALGAVIMDADAITYVPSGAQPYAESVARVLGLPLIEMTAELNPNGGKDVALARGWDNLSAFLEAQRIMLVEDVTTRLTTVNRTLMLPGMQERVKRVTAIWRRLMTGKELELPEGIEIDWLVQWHMPHMMTRGLIDHLMRQKLRLQNRQG